MLTPSEKRRFDAETLTTLLDQSDIAKESRLLETKWFAYRFMSPWESTKLFGELFQKQYRRTFEMTIDRNQAKSVKGIDLGNLRVDQKERTQLFRARQRADEVGMRYEDYLGASFEFAIGRQRNYQPRPNQLHHPKAGAVWTQFRDEFWTDRLTGGAVPLPTNPAYRCENLRGLPAQVVFREFLMKYAGRPGVNLSDQITLLCLRNRFLLPSDFKGHFPQNALAYAASMVKSNEHRCPTTPDPLPPFEETQLWQSCYGLPAAYQPQSTVCSSCPVRAECAQFGAEIAAQVAAKKGSATPLEDARRARKTQQTREQRARRKAAQAVTVSSSSALSDASVRPEADSSTVATS